MDKWTRILSLVGHSFRIEFEKQNNSSNRLALNLFKSFISRFGSSFHSAKLYQTSKFTLILKVQHSYHCERHDLWWSQALAGASWRIGRFFVGPCSCRICCIAEMPPGTGRLQKDGHTHMSWGDNKQNNGRMWAKWSDMLVGYVLFDTQYQ